MNPLTLKTLLAALALVTTGGAAAGTLALLDAADESGGNHAQSTFGGRVIDSWTGDLKSDVTTGSIDFRTARGAIHVAAWDRAAYEVTVLAPEDGENAQRYGDVELQPAFSGSVKDGALDLVLTVRESGNVDVTYDARSAYAVVAFVPALEWSSVLACAGTSGASIGRSVDELLGQERDEAPACLDSEATPRVSGHFGSIGLPGDDDDTRPRWHVPFTVDGLAVDDLVAFTKYDDLAFTNVTVRALDASTAYGSITTTGLTAQNVTAFTEYGDVTLHALRVTDVKAGTRYGDLVLDTGFAGAANAALASEYGSVRVSVPAEGERAYRVTAATEYGSLRIRLPGVTNAENASEDPEGSTVGTPALALADLAPATPASGMDAREVKSFKGETEDFAAYANRLTLHLVTAYGDVNAAATGAADADDAA